MRKLQEPGHKKILANPRQGLDPAFKLQGRRFAADLDGINQHKRPTTPQIFGRLRTSGDVLLKSTHHVGRDARVQSAVAAADDVEVPIQHVLGW